MMVYFLPEKVLAILIRVYILPGRACYSYESVLSRSAIKGACYSYKGVLTDNKGA